MKKYLYITLAVLCFLTMTLSSCSSSDEPKDDSNETNIYIQFKYDMNMVNADEFSKEVKSVAVWIFDKERKMVWSKVENAEKSFSSDFSLKANLTPGEYDVLAWCGKTSDLSILSSTAPASISASYLSLPLVMGSKGDKECNSELPVIFNGHVTGFKVDKNKKNNCVLSLSRATKDLRVMVQRLGADIKSEEFEIYIKDAANVLEWNMTPVAKEVFSYYPYNTEDAFAGSLEGENNTDDAITGMGVLIADFTTLAFSPDSHAVLVIKDLVSGKITEVALVNYLLQARPYEAADMTDQEYLDCQSNYRMMFFAESE